MTPSNDPRTTLNAMWATRPARRQSDRKIAGVAAAIARRYDVDPVLVRIGFVVSAFYGVGILLYLGAWATLPAEPGDPPSGSIRGAGPPRVLVVVVLVVAGMHGISSLVSGDFGVLVGLAVAGGLLYLLHTHRGEHGLAASRAADSAPPASVAPSEASVTGASGTGASVTGASGTEADPPGAPDGAQPPAWDPLGAAPFAWDLPEPGQPPPPRRRRSRITPVTIGLALLAGGITGSLVLAAGGVTGPRTLIGVMLAVVGIGLVIGSFTRGGRGLIVVAVPLALAAYGVTAAPVDRWQGAGELRAVPTTVAEVLPSYERTFGNVELDLRRLDLTVPAPIGGQPPPGVEPVRTRVGLQVGEAVVRVPPNADVQVHCHAGIGDVQCLGNEGVRSNGGGGTERDGPTADARVNDLGADRVAGGRPLILDVTVGTGAVEVRRD